MPKVSVIVPIYNVSCFVERCAESLMNQTMRDAEFIFVDDASPDNSVTIVEAVLGRYPERDAKIVRHSSNKGLPSARNTGLGVASGEYVFHCDGDDWVEPDLLEKLYSSAVVKAADYVYCDFFISFERNERYMHNPEYNTPYDLLCGGLLGGMTKYNVWNKLVKRALYVDNGISFPDGHPMGEDMTMIRLAACAESVAYVPEALYHYVKTNSNAYSQTQTARQLADVRYNVDLTESFLTHRFGMDLEKEISWFKLNVKLPFLISSDRSQYKLWAEWYPEANKNIMSNVAQPLRTRALQWMASHGIWLGVQAYYFLVYRLIYGVIFK